MTKIEEQRPTPASPPERAHEEARKQRLDRLRALIGQKVGQTAPVTQGPVPSAVADNVERADQLRAQQLEDIRAQQLEDASRLFGPAFTQKHFGEVAQGQATQLDDFGEVTVDPALYADRRAKPVIRPGETPVTTGPTPGSRSIEIASIPEDQLPLSDDEYFSRRMRK